MLTPTSRATAQDIIDADEERVEWAFWLAMSECGPLPENEPQFRRWCRAVNKLHRKIARRLN